MVDAIGVGCQQLENEKHDLLFAVRRSVRYHYRRSCFFDGWNRFTIVISIILGSAAVASFLNGNTITSIYPALLSFWSAFIAIISTRMARLHTDLARRFIALTVEIIRIKELTEDDIIELRVKRLEIEADEPPIKRILDIICHNELCQAEGYPESKLYHVPFYKRFLANFLSSGDASIRKR